MNNKKIIIAAVLVLVIVIAIASGLYGALGQEYTPDYGIGDKATEDTKKDGENTPPSSNKGENDTDSNTTRVAPDFTVLDKDGNAVKLSDFKGKPVVLNFWATWCTYCVQEMPVFEEAAKNHPDVQFLMLNATDGAQETMEKAKQFIADNGYTFDVFFDTELEAVYKYGVQYFPSTVVIDKDGNLVYGISSALTADILEQLIDLVEE